MADTTTHDRVKEITDQLETGIKDLFTSEKYMEYLQTMSRFRHYSTRNVMLIYSQMPNARRVAGFGVWKEKFGRTVKKGEKGISIFAPVASTIKKKMNMLDPETQAPLLDEFGEPVMEEREITIPHFKIVYVFDESQTMGKPLPQLVENLYGDVQNYSALILAIKRVSPLPIVFEKMPDDTDGTCYYGNKISIREGMSEVQTICAAVHEVVHAVLHDTTGENTAPKDSMTQEIEAESCAYSICQYLGIETSANSFAYIASWSKDKEQSVLKTSLDTIRKTSAELIDKIDGEFLMIMKMRGVELSDAAPDAVHSMEQERVSVTEKQYELGYGYMGNGLTVWNRLEEKDGDYVTVAHIERDRTVKIYDKDMPDDVRAQIENVAKTSQSKKLDPLETYEVRIITHEDGGYDFCGGTFDKREDAEAYAMLIDNDGYYGVRLKAIDTVSNEEYYFGFSITLEDAQKNEKAVTMFAKYKENLGVSHEPVAAEPQPQYSIPDSAVSTADRDSYGYTNSEILPLSQARALELYDDDHTIYMLYPDNTEAMVFDRDEIVGYDGIFGIERDEWEDTREFAVLTAAAKNSNAPKESVHDYKPDEPPISDDATSEIAVPPDLPELSSPTVVELEAQVKAGQSISVLALSNAVNRERKPARNGKQSLLAQVKANKIISNRQSPPPNRDNNLEV